MKNDNLQNSETLEYLYKRWAYENLALEIKTEEGGRATADPIERKMEEFCIHAVNKRRFINYIQRAAYEKQGLTMQEIVKLVGCTRKSVENMLKDLEGYDVIDQETNESGHFTYKASDKLMKYHLNYAKWMLKTSIDIGIRHTASTILELETLKAEPDIERVKLLRT